MFSPFRKNPARVFTTVRAGDEAVKEHFRGFATGQNIPRRQGALPSGLYAARVEASIDAFAVSR
jgi:hypothetical protein